MVWDHEAEIAKLSTRTILAGRLVEGYLVQIQVALRRDRQYPSALTLPAFFTVTNLIAR